MESTDFRSYSDQSDSDCESFKSANSTNLEVDVYGPEASHEDAVDYCHSSNSTTPYVTDYPSQISQVIPWPASCVESSDADAEDGPTREEAAIADLLCTGPILSLAQQIGTWTNPIWLGNNAALRIDQLGKGAAGKIAGAVVTEQMRQCLDLQDRSAKVVVFKRVQDEGKLVVDMHSRRQRHQVFLQEALVLCHSPIKDYQRILRLHAIFFEQDADDHNMSWPVMVLEYANEGTLADFISNWPSVGFQELRPLLRDVADALSYLHYACFIAHGDINPGNIYIFWNSETRKLGAKLGGFRSARYGQTREDRRQLPRSTHPWAAPECYRIGDHLVPLSDIMSADIYSFVLVVLSAAIDGPDDLFWFRQLSARLGGESEGLWHPVEQERYSPGLLFLLHQNARQGVDKLEIHKLLQFGLITDPRNRDGDLILAIILGTAHSLDEEEISRFPIAPFDPLQACTNVQRLDRYPICVQNNVIHEWETIAEERPVNKHLALQIVDALLNGRGNYTDEERSTKAYKWLELANVRGCLDGNIREALWLEEAIFDSQSLLAALRSSAMTGDLYALMELRARLEASALSQGQSATECINLDETEYDMGAIKEVAHSLPIYDSGGGDSIHSIVHTMARHGRDDDAIWLLNEFEGQILEWKTALHFAIGRNNIAAVKGLLRRPGLNPYKWYDPMTTRGPTCSAFLLAVQLNLVEIMRLILEQHLLWGASTLPSVAGCSALVCHCCCDPNCVDPAPANGENYLGAALDPTLRVYRMRIHGARYHDAMNQTVKLLHEVGVRMWPTNPWGGRSDIIDLAAEYSYSWLLTFIFSHPEVFPCLKRSARPQITKYPLWKAVLRGDLSVIRALLQHNAAEVMKGEVNGFHFLHLAASAGHRNLAIVEQICMAGVDLGLRDCYGRTALELAVLEGFFSMADRLTELGAALDSCDSDGITSFGKFLQMPFLPLNRVSYFLRKASTSQLPDPLCCRQVERNVFHVVAASSTQFTTKSRLTSLWRELMVHWSVYGPWINKFDRLGFTPLMLAVFHGHRELVIQLLDDGADADAFGVTNAITLAEVMLNRAEYLQRKQGNTRESRLTRRAVGDRTDIVRVLQERGCEAKYNLLGLPKVDYQTLSGNYHPSNTRFYITALANGLKYFQRGSHDTGPFQETEAVSFYQRILNPPDIAALVQGSAEYVLMTSLDPFTAASKTILENPFVQVEFARSAGLGTGRCSVPATGYTRDATDTQTRRNLDINLASLTPLLVRLCPIVLKAGTLGPAGVASRAALTLLTHWIIHEHLSDGRQGLRITQGALSDIHRKVLEKLRSLPVVGLKIAELIDAGRGQTHI